MNIPISQIVQVNPGIVEAGSRPLALNGLVITYNALVPTRTVITCYSPDDVMELFGASSREYAFSQVYFGRTNVRQSVVPSALYFVRYSALDAGAWVRGDTVDQSLDYIQAVSGSLSVTIDGVEKTASSLSLSSVSSYSAAATAIGNALSLSDGQTCSWNAESKFFIIRSGTVGVTSTITRVSGTAASALGFNSNQQISQGTDVFYASSAFDLAVKANQNWATFTLIPSSSSPPQDVIRTLAERQAIYNNRYLFVAWDDNADALTSSPSAETVFGPYCKANQLNVIVCWNNPLVAALVMNIAASINWNAVNGRTAFAFKSMEGLEPTVSALDDANTLLANGYSYYGAYSGDGEGNSYNIFYDGKLGGSFGWVDTYVNQIFLNSQLRLAMFDLLRGVNALPYNEVGRSQIRAAAIDPINQGLLNGTIRTGIQLSESQKAQVQAMVGFDISHELYTKGYYLYVGEATAQTRGQRTSPPIYFFYCDGGSIQKITIPSVVIQ